MRSSSSETSSKRPRIDSDIAMATVDSSESMVFVENGDADAKEIFNSNSKAIIWGMQPRAVQVVFYLMWHSIYYDCNHQLFMLYLLLLMLIKFLHFVPLDILSSIFIITSALYFFFRGCSISIMYVPENSPPLLQVSIRSG